MSRLELTFRSRAGRTYLAAQFVASPLKVLRPFTLADGRVVLQVLNVGPGLMAGDAFDLNVRVEQGAKVVLVNQSATKLHAMPAGSARQTVTLHVERGAELEVYPGLVIPFRDAEFDQRTRAHLERGARFGTVERWSMGRVAHNELFGFRRLSSRLQVYREGNLVYGDGLELTPQTAPLTGVSDKHSYLAAGVWLWAEDKQGNEEAQRKTVRPALREASLVEGSFEEGRYLRSLGSDGLEHAEQVRSALNLWRAACALAPLCLSRFGQGV